MLTPQTPDDIAALAGRCDEIAAILRKLQAEMITLGPSEVDLSVGKADSFLDYLKTWADACKRKHENDRKKEKKRLAIEAAKATGKKTHDAAERRRSRK